MGKCLVCAPSILLTKIRITPWLTNLGYQNCFISAAFVGLAASCMFLVMVKFGKGLRVKSSSKYYAIVAADRAKM